jgi:hypothetical protein
MISADCPVLQVRQRARRPKGVSSFHLFCRIEESLDPESDSPDLSMSSLGRRSQVGGAIAAFIGVLLLVVTPPAPPGAPVNIHQMAMLFIAIGAFCVAAGTLARWYYLK